MFQSLGISGAICWWNSKLSGDFLFERFQMVGCCCLVLSCCPALMMSKREQREEASWNTSLNWQFWLHSCKITHLLWMLPVWRVMDLGWFWFGFDFTCFPPSYVTVSLSCCVYLSWSARSFVFTNQLPRLLVSCLHVSRCLALISLSWFLSSLFVLEDSVRVKSFFSYWSFCHHEVVILDFDWFSIFEESKYLVCLRLALPPCFPAFGSTFLPPPQQPGTVTASCWRTASCAKVLKHSIIGLCKLSFRFIQKFHLKAKNCVPNCF